MTELSKEDLEELYTRRLTERVVELAEQAIKRRYLWINVAGGLAFMLVSWLGGAALLTNFVKASVDEQVKEQSAHLRALELETTASSATLKTKLAQIQETLDGMRETGKALGQKLQDTKDQASATEQQLTQIVGATNAVRKNSDDIAVLRRSVDQVVQLSEVVAQLEKAIARQASAAAATGTAAAAPVPAIAQAQATQITQSLSDTSKQLAQSTVFIQFSGAVTRAQIDAIRTALGHVLPITVPPAERVASRAREVRYFYDQDKLMAESVASATQRVLMDINFGPALTVASKSYVDYSKTKPSPGTIELWLGDLPAPRT